jgi:CHASE3 domain sensor protein
MSTQLNQALSADRATELRRAAERSRISAEYRSHRGSGAAMAIRRYFDHARAAHKQPLRRPAKRTG